MINVNDKEFVCHIDLAVNLIKGKWKAVILWHLNRGTKRFLELQRITTGISQKVLNEKLKELEEDELIYKTVYAEVPPRVEFNLTQKGLDLIPALEIMENWALMYHPAKHNKYKK